MGLGHGDSLIEITEISESCRAGASLDKQALLMIKARNTKRGDTA
jgi:hypothetical protein